MLRGTTLSGLLHGTLILGLIFGLPTLPSIFSRDFPEENSWLRFSVEIVSADTVEQLVSPPSLDRLAAPSSEPESDSRAVPPLPPSKTADSSTDITRRTVSEDGRAPPASVLTNDDTAVRQDAGAGRTKIPVGQQERREDQQSRRKRDDRIAPQIISGADAVSSQQTQVIAGRAPPTQERTETEAALSPGPKVADNAIT